MISIHGIAGLKAITSHTPDAHWLELIFIEPDGETQVTLTLYFQTRNAGFAEERRFTLALAEAINNITPMDIGEWDSAQSTLSPREEAQEAGF
jgi:hypothetical protein